MSNKSELATVAIVIPAFRASRTIVSVVNAFRGPGRRIIVVDDNCPDKSGDVVTTEFEGDLDVHVVYNAENLGVGGATKAGFVRALEMQVDFVIKADADGQMDPTFAPVILRMLRDNGLDFVKGNRFSSIKNLSSMPQIRLLGNGILTFLSRMSTGYWQLSDPTNGYFGLRASVLESLELDKLSNSFFFESDLIFRMSLIDAAVGEVPMPSIYGEEQSNLKPLRVAPEFLAKHFRNFGKRLLYQYYLLAWSPGTFFLPIGLGLLFSGLAIGVESVSASSKSGDPTNSGTVTLVAMLTLVGVQFLLAFVSEDSKRRS